MNAPVLVSLELVNEKVRFRGAARDLPPVEADYFPPLGDGLGYTGLELLLLSLAACSASTIVPLLRRMQKSVAGFRVRSSGQRRDRHPTSLERIDIEFELTSPDASEDDLRKAVQMSEETFCPVWAMLKGSAEIAWTARVAAP